MQPVDLVGSSSLWQLRFQWRNVLRALRILAIPDTIRSRESHCLPACYAFLILRHRFVGIRTAISSNVFFKYVARMSGILLMRNIFQIAETGIEFIAIYMVYFIASWIAYKSPHNQNMNCNSFLFSIPAKGHGLIAMRILRLQQAIWNPVGLSFSWNIESFNNGPLSYSKSGSNVIIDHSCVTKSFRFFNVLKTQFSQVMLSPYMPEIADFIKSFITFDFSPFFHLEVSHSAV